MENEIKPIPEKMEKFFGCSGQMIKPSASTVEAVVSKIPRGKLITLEQLRNEIAAKYKVQTSCPAHTTKILQILSKEDEPTCYWRVIKKKGELIAKFPGGIEGHALLLEKEGLKINYDRKIPVVLDYETKIT